MNGQTTRNIIASVMTGAILGTAGLAFRTYENANKAMDKIERLDDDLSDWRDTNRRETDKSLAALATAISELQETTSKLAQDSIRTRTIVELSFPQNAARVRDALSGITEDNEGG